MYLVKVLKLPEYGISPKVIISYIKTPNDHTSDFVLNAFSSAVTSGAVHCHSISSEKILI
jgi:hypothetical protein